MNSKTIFALVITAIAITATIGAHVFASSNNDAPSAPSYVDTIKMPSGYFDIAKMYDPYANVICYESQSVYNTGVAISCVKGN